MTIGGAKFSRYVAPASATDPPYVSRSLTVLPTRLGMVAALCLTDAAGPGRCLDPDRGLALRGDRRRSSLDQLTLAPHREDPADRRDPQ